MYKANQRMLPTRTYRSIIISMWLAVNQQAQCSGQGPYPAGNLEPSCRCLPDSWTALQLTSRKPYGRQMGEMYWSEEKNVVFIDYTKERASALNLRTGDRWLTDLAQVLLSIPPT